MTLTRAIAGLPVLLAACATSGPNASGAAGAPPGIAFEGGDGLSCEGRVVIRGARGEQQGIAAEYAWLRRRYPGHKVTGQSLGDCQQRAADIMSIRTADGREVEVHFDIGDFFGKGF
ncbi:MAG TPA: hypothetical protein VIF57_19560 [Polyangia bacterium]